MVLILVLGALYLRKSPKVANFFGSSFIWPPKTEILGGKQNGTVEFYPRKPAKLWPISLSWYSLDIQTGGEGRTQLLAHLSTNTLLISLIISKWRKPQYRMILSSGFSFPGGRGGVVVSALDFRSEGRWFDAQSLSLCCLLKQETLPHIVSLHPGV